MRRPRSRPRRPRRAHQTWGFLTPLPPPPVPAATALPLGDLIKGAVEDLRAQCGNALGAFSAAGPVHPRAVKTIGVVVVAPDGCSILHAGATKLMSSRGGPLLMKQCQQGGLSMSSAVLRGRAAFEYGAFCPPKNCSVLVLIPRTLVTGDEMLAAALPGFKRCTDVSYTGKIPQAQLGLHKMTKMFPMEQANALYIGKNGPMPMMEKNGESGALGRRRRRGAYTEANGDQDGTDESGGEEEEEEEEEDRDVLYPNRVAKRWKRQPAGLSLSEPGSEQEGRGAVSDDGSKPTGSAPSVCETEVIQAEEGTESMSALPPPPVRVLRPPMGSAPATVQPKMVTGMKRWAKAAGGRAQDSTLFNPSGAGHARGVQAYDRHSGSWKDIGPWICVRQTGTLPGLYSVDFRHLEVGGPPPLKGATAVPGWIGVCGTQPEQGSTDAPHVPPYTLAIYDGELARRVFLQFPEFDTAEDAARAYDRLALAYYGGAKTDLNFPPEDGAREAADAAAKAAGTGSKALLLRAIRLLNLERDVPHTAVREDVTQQQWDDWEDYLLEKFIYKRPKASTKNVARLGRKLAWMLEQVIPEALRPRWRAPGALKGFLERCKGCETVGTGVGKKDPPNPDTATTLMALLHCAAKDVMSDAALEILGEGGTPAAAAAAANEAGGGGGGGRWAYRKILIRTLNESERKIAFRFDKYAHVVTI